jgi:hypothetical protein
MPKWIQHVQTLLLRQRYVRPKMSKGKCLNHCKFNYLNRIRYLILKSVEILCNLGENTQHPFPQICLLGSVLVYLLFFEMSLRYNFPDLTPDNEHIVVVTLPGKLDYKNLFVTTCAQVMSILEDLHHCTVQDGII